MPTLWARPSSTHRQVLILPYFRKGDAPSIGPRHRSTRAPYNASDAGYVITICAHHRKSLFGTIEDGRLLPSSIGALVEREWDRTAEMRPGAQLDAFILMPNHLHGVNILHLPDDTLTGRQAVGAVATTCVRPFQAPSVGIEAIVRGFKSDVTSAVKKKQGDGVGSVWQRGYHDRIIRNEPELERFRSYIANNPRQWELDRYFAQEAGGPPS